MGTLAIIVAAILGADRSLALAAGLILIATLIFGLAMIFIELTLPAMTEDFRRAGELILRGALSVRFWAGVVLIGTVLPVAMLAIFFGTGIDALALAAAVLGLIGLWIFENIWIDAGQAVPLS